MITILVWDIDMSDRMIFIAVTIVQEETSW